MNLRSRPLTGPLPSMPCGDVTPAFATRRERREFERRHHAARSFPSSFWARVASHPTARPPRPAPPLGPAAGRVSGPATPARPAGSPRVHPRGRAKAVRLATVGAAILLAVVLLGLATLGPSRLAPSGRPAPAPTAGTGLVTPTPDAPPAASSGGVEPTPANVRRAGESR